MYVNSPGRLDADPCCYVNGVEAACTSTSQVETADGRHVLAVRIEPKQPLEAGARVFAELLFDDGTRYGGATKIFRPFVAGKTQYELIVRPVEIVHDDDAIKLTLYNEADHRKPPAKIEKVKVNGEDVTDLSVLPQDAIPPDLQNYDEDVRELVVRYPSSVAGDRLRFDIDFRRLTPLRPKATPLGYFETQTASFSTHQGVPLAIGPESGFGLEGGACIFYGGLRPRPDVSEIVRRSGRLAEEGQAIPVYACAPRGMKFRDICQLAACCEFMMVSQPDPFSEATLYRSGRFFDSFGQLESLPVPWAASVVLDDNLCSKPEELEWIT